MRLYYMTTLDTLEQHILPKLRVRLSTFDTVNDPFELLGARQTNRKNRRHFSELYKYWVETLGFVSFSDNWKSPLMWGHYAANHTGVCLGFDVPDDRVWEVKYEQERIELLLNRSSFADAFDKDLIKQVVTTKFEDWAYEREWRYIENLNDKDPETGLYYVEFSPDFELREIIVGARCKRKPRSIRKQIFGNTGKITIFQTRAGFGSFSMVRQKLHETLTVEPFHKVAGMGTRRRRH